MSTIFAIVGASGVGKTTAVEYASRALGVGVVRSYTTRPMREGEVDGIDHIFVTADQMPPREEMAAYTLFGGNHYWATMKQCTEQDVFYVIDEKGLFELVEKIGNRAQIVKVYIAGKRETDAARADRDKERAVIAPEDYDAIVVNDGSLEDFLEKFVAVIKRLLD